jgi:hypothetical protein
VEVEEGAPMSDTESTGTDEDSSESGSAFTVGSADEEVSDEEREQLEKERAERLDPENRPVNAEVDNTGREFDAEKGDFKYAAGEEPGAEERTTPVIGADRPEGVEVEEDED